MSTETKPKRFNYMFDCGNSSSGPVGLVVRVIAETPEQAVELGNDYLAQFHDMKELDVYDQDEANGIDYATIYFGELKLSDIEHGETVEVSI